MLVDPVAAFGLTHDDQPSRYPRSKLAVHAGNPPRPLRKGFRGGADVAILDLEDAVAPKDKAQARTTALDYLAGDPADGALHALRINGLDTRAGISDLDALLGSRAAPNFLVLPKTETAGHLQILDRLLTAAGKDHQAHRPDRERAWSRRSGGDRDRNATARGSDAGRCRYGGRPRGGHCMGSRSPSLAAG